METVDTERQIVNCVARGCTGFGPFCLGRCSPAWQQLAFLSR